MERTLHLDLLHVQKKMHDIVGELTYIYSTQLHTSAICYGKGEGHISLRANTSKKFEWTPEPKRAGLDRSQLFLLIAVVWNTLAAAGFTLGTGESSRS